MIRCYKFSGWLGTENLCWLGTENIKNIYIWLTIQTTIIESRCLYYFLHDFLCNKSNVFNKFLSTYRLLPSKLSNNDVEEESKWKANKLCVTYIQLSWSYLKTFLELVTQSEIFYPQTLSDTRIVVDSSR